MADPSIDKLAELTGWKEEQIQQAMSYLQDDDLYQSVEGLLQLKQCFDLCATLGCDIDFLCNLCDLLENGSVANNWDTYQQVGSSVIHLAKAKYSNEEWEKVFGELNGTLEERKSQILTEFTLWTLQLENRRQLSEYLLLDVEMTSCACNSLIQLAILSVQTYLQRCHMGVEQGVTQVDIPPVWWEWIPNYRIWEANRKVFLYPENYIDPSLRRDASPLFKELQDELLQSDITAEAVESAYRNYFDKIAELAKLQIVDSGRYWVQTSKSPDPIDTLFILAKTLTQPHTFYYRRCEQPTAEKPLWGYWEKIDLQINSDYLAPVHAFNRLFVFWAETKEIKQSQDEDPTTQATIKYSFLNTSQKWVSPQTLVADVEIPSDFGVTVDESFWQQVYPMVVPEPNLQSELITAVFGGLQSLPSSEFNQEQEVFFEARKQILDDSQSELAATIASDLLPDSTPFLERGNSSSLTLSQARSSLAATTVGNLAIFAGGLYGGNNSNTVDVFAYEDGTLVEKKDLSLTLSQGRYSLAATTVGNLAIFAGGSGSDPNKVDVFAYQDGTLVKKDLSLTLSEARASLAATTVGNLAIFAGGLYGGNNSNTVDVFAYEDGTLVKKDLSLTLSEARASLAATTVGNLAIFAGGYRGGDYFNKVDVFAYQDGTLVKKDLSLTLSEARASLAATTVGNLAIFAGGWISGSSFNTVDVFEYKDGTLEKKDTLTLSQARDSLAATTIGNLAIFPGGLGSSGGSNKVDVFAYENGTLVKKDLSLTLSQGRYNLAATTVGNLAIFAGGSTMGSSNTVDVFYTPSPTFKTLPSNLALPTNTTVTPIKNQSESFIFQRRSEAFSSLDQNVTRLTTSAIQHFSQTLFAQGLDGLLSLASQQISEPDFPLVPHSNHLDFDSAYGPYFWEIFFHIPFLIASTLNGNQRYNEARKWYQYIFDPTIPGQDKERFWRFLPFQEHTPQKLKDILTNEAAIQAYKENPFDPHAIARLRIGAYEKAVVMNYIDNLLDWGDTLFTQDNWESITQATTLYLLAYDLLGAKPENLGKPPTPPPATFADIKTAANGNIPEFLIDLENNPEYQEFIKQFGDEVPFNALDAYFCVSENQDFAKYWERVEDRLFKIRHCQNIQGIERQLALFQPPIDPSQLVGQAAAGDGSINLPTTSNIPHYRFSYLLERAKTMVSTVIQLGSTFLNTLEKKDAEELALLRATQEPVLLQLITKTKEKQIEAAEANLTSLEKSLDSAKGRSQHYQNLITGGWIAEETATVALMGSALGPQIAANAIRGGAIASYLLPNVFGLADGGMQFGDAVNMGSAILDGTAGILSQNASIASTTAQFQRREEDWQFQQQMAEWDVEQIEAQIEAAKIQIDLAKAELEVNQKSIEQSQEVEQFFKDKFINKKLYQWMVGRLSGLYFQTYKIALAMAY